MRWMAHRPPTPSGPIVRWLSLGLALAVLFGPAAVAAASPASYGPYSSASIGDLQVTFPSAYPDVQLGVVGGHSVASDLVLQQILESTASASAPQIVAVALPSDVVVTNATTSGSSLGLLFSLTADLTVYPSNAGLWQGPGDLVQPDGAPLGTAHLAINYSAPPSDGASHGVTTAWSVTDWPWVAPSDLLGVQLSLSTPSATSQIACTGTSASVEQAGCPGPTVSGGPSLWSAQVLGVQGPIPSGPTALVSWGSGFSTPSGPASPVSVGVLADSTSTSHLVLAAPGNGAPTVGGSVSFALLSAAAAIPAPLLVHGQPNWYFAGFAASGLAGLAGLIAFRRRQRGIEAAL